MIFVKCAQPNRLLIRGIVAIAIGVTILSVPDFSLKLMMQLLGALLFADGIIAFLAEYYSGTKNAYRIVPRGTSNLIIGVILLVFPSLLVKVFVFVLGILLAWAGITQLLNQFESNGKLKISWLMALISIIALIAGVLLITQPFESAQAILMLFGIALAIYGVGELIWSFKIRKLNRQIK